MFRLVSPNQRKGSYQHLAVRAPFYYSVFFCGFFAFLYLVSQEKIHELQTKKRNLATDILSDAASIPFLDHKIEYLLE